MHLPGRSVGFPVGVLCGVVGESHWWDVWWDACEYSEYFRFNYIINYLLTGLLSPYREILSSRFLRTDLASSVRTSKPRARA